jgi:predicted Zn finger-like uncharacterized protein
MPGRKLTCPECDGWLSIAQTVPAGKKIRCPKCGTIFRLPDPDAEAVRTATLARANEPDEEDTDDDADARRPRRRRSRRTKPDRTLAVVAIAVGLVLLIGGGVGVALWVFKPWQRQPVVVVQAPQFRPGGGFPQAAVPAKGLLPGGKAPDFKPFQPAKSNVPQVGQQAPEIAGEDLDGRPFKLSDYRGKVVVLDFWGNW